MALFQGCHYYLKTSPTKSDTHHDVTNFNRKQKIVNEGPYDMAIINVIMIDKGDSR